ncbi:glycoside hydrolase family 16 protein [Ekhidna sp.]
MKRKILIPGSLTIVASILFGAQLIYGDRYKTVWEDNFDFDKIDHEFWTVVTGDGCPDLCGWGNKELQYYTDLPENVRIENGVLVLEAHLKDTVDSFFSSAKLATKGKLDFRYGRFEMKAKLPVGRGTWMAFWMLPTVDGNAEWPADGEIDIVEHVGYNPGTIYGAIHTTKYNGMIGTHKVDSVYVKNVDSEFHVYAVEWSENEIKWFVDDNMYNHLKRNEDDVAGWPFNQYDYHLIINLAVGGTWGGKAGVEKSAFPQRLEIDYVRYLTK